MESRRQSPGSQAGLSSPSGCHQRSSTAPAERSPSTGKPLGTRLLSSYGRGVRRAEGSHLSILGLGLQGDFLAPGIGLVGPLRQGARSHQLGSAHYVGHDWYMR